MKSPAELALMRLASEVTWKAYKAAFESLRDGMSQDDFARLVSQAHDRQGFSGGAGVQVGEVLRAAARIDHAAGRSVRAPILLIDGGCNVGGYKSDLSRTFVLGKATDRMKQVFEVEHRAQTAAVQTARPGLECEAVDAAARKVIERRRLRPRTTSTSPTGWATASGWTATSGPTWSRATRLPLAPGMTFSDEPGIYIPGEFGSGSKTTW